MSGAPRLSRVKVHKEGGETLETAQCEKKSRLATASGRGIAKDGFKILVRIFPLSRPEKVGAPLCVQLCHLQQ